MGSQYRTEKNRRETTSWLSEQSQNIITVNDTSRKRKRLDSEMTMNNIKTQIILHLYQSIALVQTA
jgi:hypothetical protein